MEQICAYITALEKRIENTEKENEQLRKFKEEVETKAKAETKAKEEAETKAKEEAETKDLEDDFDLSAVVYADNAKYNRELIKPIFEYLRAKIFSKTEGYIQAFQNNIKCFEVSFIEDCLNKFGKKSVIGVLIENRLRKNKYFALEMLASDNFYFDVLFIYPFETEELAHYICKYNSRPVDTIAYSIITKICKHPNVVNECVKWSCKNNKFSRAVQTLLDHQKFSDEQAIQLFELDINYNFYKYTKTIEFAKIVNKNKITKEIFDRLFENEVITMRPNDFLHYNVYHQPHIWEYAKKYSGVFCQIAWSRGKYDAETTKKMAEKLHTGDLHLFGVINNIPEICETVHTRLMNIKNNIDKKIDELAKI